MGQLNEIGAVWKRTGKSGEYLTGSITINNIVYEIKLFKNDYKKLDKHPDYKVMLATPDDQPAPRNTEPVINHNSRSESVLPVYPEYPEEINPEDIPF